MRRFLRILIWTLIVLVIVCGLTAYFLYRGTQKVPEFYQEAMAAPLTPQKQRQLGQQLEREAAQLHNQVRREGRWEATFTEEQVNAWLAVDLAEKLPSTLPSGVSAPRVRISPDRIHTGCKYETDGFSTVVSLETDAYLTDKPNQVAVRIHSVRAGSIPLPFRGLLEQVANSARQNGVDLRWSQQDGDPVALIQVPLRQQAREISVESIELRDGEIALIGQTKSADD